MLRVQLLPSEDGRLILLPDSALAPHFLLGSSIFLSYYGHQGARSRVHQ